MFLFRTFFVWENIFIILLFTEMFMERFEDDAEV